MGKMSLYKEVINSDLMFLNTYSSYRAIIESVMDKIDGVSFQGDFSPVRVSSSTSSILENSRCFYESLPGDYPDLFKRYIADKNNSFSFKRIKDDDVPFGETTPIYGTPHSSILSGYNHTFEDYTTAIHEYSHGISSMLNPNQFFDVGKYCLVETDSIFFELVGNDFTATRLGLQKEAINSSLDILSDNLLDIEIIYSKIQMYFHTSFKWKKANIEEYLRGIGYTEDGIEYFTTRYLKDCFHYIISYLNAIELYEIYKQDAKSAIEIVKKIVQKTNCTPLEYLNYVTDFGIHPGESIYSYFNGLQKKDQEAGYGKRLQYKIK